MKEIVPRLNGIGNLLNDSWIYKKDRGSKSRGTLRARKHSFDSRISLRISAGIAPSRGAVHNRALTETKNRKDALAAGRWRTGEELGMPIADGRARYVDRHDGFESDQNNRVGHDRNRRGRVHGHAERAMVGIAIERMDVRYLDHGQQRQQRQTQQSAGPESSRLRGAHSAEMWLELCQQNHPQLQGYTKIVRGRNSQGDVSTRFFVQGRWRAAGLALLPWPQRTRRRWGAQR